MLETTNGALTICGDFEASCIRSEEHSRMARAELSKICREIGCSGFNKSCPGNPNCEILVKLLGRVEDIRAQKRALGIE